LGGGGGRIRAGDTVWVRSGNYSGSYTSSLSGSSNSPVVLRAYPGERASLNGSLVVQGQYTWVWGLEIYQSNPTGTSQIALNAYGVGTRLINNTVHDAGMSGIGFWWNTQGGEAYGNIVYNNGTHDNLDHGIYFNNRTGTKRLADNVVFNNWAYGFHGYSGTSGELVGLVLDGNVSFGGHGIGRYVSSDVMIGGSAIPNLTITNHRSFKPDGYLSGMIGRADGPQNGSASVTNGYFVGSPGLQTNRWSSVSKSGTVEINYASRPSSGSSVTVRPNAYERGRGHVVVYNWSKAGSVSVDLSKVLASGQRYTVHNVCNLSGNPVASGTYSGGSVSLSMATMPPPALIGRSAKRTPPSCGGMFAVFLVRPA
jgi:hypothetical protein